MAARGCTTSVLERDVWRRGWDDGWTAVTSRVPGVTAAVVAGAVVGQLVPSNGSIWSRVLLSVVFALAAFAVVVLVSFAVSLRRVPYRQRDEARLELAHERTLREEEPDAQQVAAQKALDPPTPSEPVAKMLATGDATSFADGLAAAWWYRYSHSEGDMPHRTIVLRAGEREVQVSISPAGRSVRVFVDGNEVGP